MGERAEDVGEPVRYRLPRWTAWALVGAVVAGLALLWLSWSVRLSSLAVPGIMLVVAGVWAGWVALRGGVTVDTAGIRTTSVRTVWLPWSRVARLVVVEAGRSRRLLAVSVEEMRYVLPAPQARLLAPNAEFDEQVAAITRRRRAGRPDAPTEPRTVEVSAPRRRAQLAGMALIVLLPAAALLVGVDRPWYSPWWPGVHEAVATPNPCRVVVSDRVTRAAVHRLVGSPPGRVVDRSDNPYIAVRVCTWRGTTGRLSVRYERMLRTTSASGTDQAVEAMARRRPPGAMSRCGPIGDRCLADFGRSYQQVTVRRANMLIMVDCAGDFCGHRSDLFLLVRRATAAVAVN